MKRSERIRRILQIALLVFTLAWIWGHSCVPTAESTAESERVVTTLQQNFHDTAVEKHITEHLVRKMAHFLEFAFLGAQVMFFFRHQKKTFSLVAVAMGSFVASVDETIQFFTSRGPRISDVGIDTAGVVTGVLFVLLCTEIWRSRTKKT